MLDDGDDEASRNRAAPFAAEQQELKTLLSQEEWVAARVSTLNAHYTHLDMTRALWDAAAALGFDRGRVLEPGCGVGNFLALAPPSAQLTGIELDPTTAAIARLLYPDADIRTESFADTRAPEGFFDLAIGNVPYGKVALHDPRHNPSGHSIHNHFLLKALHLVRPGGLLLAMTSRYTMDAANPAIRRELAQVADLLGAVRQPTGAHRRSAGTDAVLDTLVFRRRREPRQRGEEFWWEQVVQAEVSGGQVALNPYWTEHPGHVLGELALTERGMYAREDLDVRPLPARDPIRGLADALQQIAHEAHGQGLAMPPLDPDQDVTVALAEPGDRTRRPDGFLAIGPDGAGFTQVVDGAVDSYWPPQTQAGELRALLQLRDTAMDLLEAEAANADDTPAQQQLRDRLNQQYDTYLAAYGPVNRFTWQRTGRIDEETGEEKMRRLRPPQGGFRTDPFAPLVQALETYDPTDQSAVKAAIFTDRVLTPRAQRLGADTPADAIAICLDTHGRLELDEIARLLGTGPDSARAQLGTLAFDDPDTGRLVSAAEYLSGDVRAKLQTARAAVADDPAMRANITALEAVIPDDIAAEDISVRLGAAWIEADVVQQFLRETLDDPTLRVYHPGGAIWEVDGRELGVAATSTWGTDRIPAPKLAQRLLQAQPISIRDTSKDPATGNEKSVFNPGATEAVIEKAEQLNERFAEWLWEDPERAVAMARLYNDTYNGMVLRNYDDYELSLPGLAATFHPLKHQTAAVARIINEPSALLAHAVGAGKTAEMVMGAMELRRLGLARKPCFVVPNHVLDQFRDEFLRLYPQAMVLAASSEDLRGEHRRRFVAKCATGDWDGIILTHDAFGRIPVGAKVLQAYMDKEIQTFRAWLDQSPDSRNRAARRTVKRTEKLLATAIQRMKAQLDKPRDEGVCFERTGIDILFVDEAHAFKNRRTPSNIPDAVIAGSERASDLDMKIDHLRSTGSTGHHLVFATATPVMNSITETHVMTSFVRPDLLADRSLTVFDAWANTFGQITSGIEVTPDGGSFRQKARFARFVNTPELLHQWWAFADVKTREDLGLPVPDLIGDKPEVVTIPATDELTDYVQQLVERAQEIRDGLVESHDDNMLNVTTDGRHAALDLRLLGQQQGTPGKLEVAADQIAAIWREHRDHEYTRPDGSPDPVRGALQIVFSDLGTPGDHWNVYDQIRDELTTRGIPREQVRFIHEATNDKAKAELFAACRAGRVAVLVGSTQKMGVGTNIQKRAVALHHLDPPWRPGDVEQREGRILRQGNQNGQVRILRYVVEGSFDAYMWQAILRKALYIDQLMRGRLDVREIEDPGDGALSYAEVMAAATGNPLLLEKAAADAELAKLRRRARAHERSQGMLRHTIRTDTQAVDHAKDKLAKIEQALQIRQPTEGENFAMRVDGVRHTKRRDAGQALKARISRELRTMPGDLHTARVGELAGFGITVVVQKRRDGTTFTISPDVPCDPVDLRLGAWQGQDPVGLVQRLEHRINDLDARHQETTARIGHLVKNIDAAGERLGKPFPGAAALDTAQARVDELDAQLRAAAEEEEKEHHPAASHDQPGSAPDTAPDAGPGTTARHAPEPSGRAPATTRGSTPLDEQLHRMLQAWDELGTAIEQYGPDHSPRTRELIRRNRLSAGEIRRMLAGPATTAAAYTEPLRNLHTRAGELERSLPSTPSDLHRAALRAGRDLRTRIRQIAQDHSIAIQTAAQAASASSAAAPASGPGPEPEAEDEPHRRTLTGPAAQHAREIVEQWFDFRTALASYSASDSPLFTDPVWHGDLEGTHRRAQILGRLARAGGQPIERAVHPLADLATGVQNLLERLPAEPAAVTNAARSRGEDLLWQITRMQSTHDLEPPDTDAAGRPTQPDPAGALPTATEPVPGPADHSPATAAAAGTDETTRPSAGPPAQPAGSHPGGRPTDGTGTPAPIRIEHSASGTAVTGTDPNDAAVRRALSETGFKYSGRQELWYLNSTWKEPTRRDRLAMLTSRLERHGRPFDVHNPDNGRTAHRRPEPERLLVPAPGRFTTVEQVLAHWKTGPDPMFEHPPDILPGVSPRDIADPRDRRIREVLNLSVPSKEEKYTRLSTYGTFVISRGAYDHRWDVYHAATGMHLGWTREFYRSRAMSHRDQHYACDLADRLEHARTPDGRPFDWHAPFPGDRLQLADGRDLVQALFDSTLSPSDTSSNPETAEPARAANGREHHNGHAAGTVLAHLPDPAHRPPASEPGPEPVHGAPTGPPPLPDPARSQR